MTCRFFSCAGMDVSWPSTKNARRTLASNAGRGCPSGPGSSAADSAPGCGCRVEALADLVEPSDEQPILHVRVPGPGFDQAGIAQPIEVMDDGPRRQAKAIGQLLDGHRPGGQQPDDAQARRVGQGLEDEQEVVVHGASAACPMI